MWLFNHQRKNPLSHYLLKTKERNTKLNKKKKIVYSLHIINI